MVGTKAKTPRDFGTLEGMLGDGASERRLPPVERWQPPYCGDIGLQIRGDGVWLYRDSPIRRASLVELFASVLRKDADGRTYLVTPTEKVDVAVEDAPFLAVDMEVRGTGCAQQIAFRTNVDDVVVCGPEHPLRFAEQQPGKGLKPYVLVRGGLEALLTRALLHDLVALAVEEEPRASASPACGAAEVSLRLAPQTSGSVHHEVGSDEADLGGVSSLLLATITLNSLPSSFADQKSRKPLSLGKRG
jgi:hypothetical protein